MKYRTRWLAALAVIPLALTGCTATVGNSSETPAAGSAGDMTIAVISHGTPGDTYWDVVKSGAIQAGKDLGIKITYQGDGDPVKQSQLIDSAVASHVDGLVISMANPDGLKDSVEKAVAAGIPVITIDSGLEKSKEFGAITHIGQSEYIAGEGAGEKMKEAGLTNVICVIHEAGNTGLEDRCRGAKDTFGGTVKNIQVDVSNVADAGNIITSTLLADPSIDGVLTLGPPVAIAASQAIDEAKSSAELATFDLSEDVTKLISDGKMLFAVDAQPYLMGYLPVVFIMLHKTNGNEVGGGQPVYSGPGFVTKDNVAQIEEFAKNGTR